MIKTIKPFFTAVIGCAVLGLLFSVPAQAKVLDIQEVTSKGGMSAWLVEDHSLPIIALRFAFQKAGAAYDPEDKQGLALLVSNDMDEGAGDLPSQQFQKLLDDNSITLSFSSGRDAYQGTLQTLTRHKDLAFKLLTMALTQPRFDEEPLERMRAANLARVKSAVSDPNWMAARLTNDVAYAGHPYALNAGGTLTTLKNITTDDLREFVKTRLAKDRLKIAVVGDITAAELKTLLDQVFGALPDSLPVKDLAQWKVQNGGKTYLYKQDIPQTVIRILQPGIARDDPDFQKAQVMNYIFGGGGFGSHLMETIREKRGLTYGIYSGLDDMRALNSLIITSSTKNETAGELLSLTRKVMAEMKTTPVSEDELDRAKSVMIGALPLQLTSSSGIADMLIGLMIDDLPVDYLDKREAAIRAVTVKDVEDMAKRLLEPDHLTTILVGDPDKSVKVDKTVDRLPNVE